MASGWRPARARRAATASTRAMGPTPNGGRPVAPLGGLPVRGSRACTPSLVAGAGGHPSRALTAPEYNAPQRESLGTRPVRATRATIRPMTTRRGARPTHVRPRPPSSGRPAPVKARPRAPAPGRLATPPPDRARPRHAARRPDRAGARHRRPRRRRPVRRGGRARDASPGPSARRSAGFVDDVTATARAEPVRRGGQRRPVARVARRAVHQPPQVDLVVTVPAAIVGDTTHRIRVYLALKDQTPSPSWRCRSADRQDRRPGRADQGHQRLLGHDRRRGGESEPSPVVRYVLDNAKPKVTITSPKDNAHRQRQERRASRARPRAARRSSPATTTNGASIAGTAEADGTFALEHPDRDRREPRSRSTRPTRPATSATTDADRPARLRQADGRRSSASAYQISRKALPEAIRLTATVTDPDGQPLEGARRDVHAQHPGHPDGHRRTGRPVERRARRSQTTIPKGATVGQGSATVLVSSDELGSTQDFTVITIVK